MIVGVFLQNYKCYKGVHFLPFVVDQPKNLNVFIGNNGAGKSSILEALDTFFNGRDWTLHYEAGKTAYTAPLFLMDKAACKKKLSKTSRELLEEVSSAFWEGSDDGFKTHYPDYNKLREKLSAKKTTHYLFSIGKSYENSDVNFKPFDSLLKAEELRVKLNKSDIPKLLQKLRIDILNYYSYLYIPVETSINEFLHLEAKGMQELMSIDIKSEVIVQLNKNITPEGKKLNIFGHTTVQNEKKERKKRHNCLCKNH